MNWLQNWLQQKQTNKQAHGRKIRQTHQTHYFHTQELMSYTNFRVCMTPFACTLHIRS